MWTDKEGKTWYKGNLHLHTTVSDGVKTPEEAYELYRSRGYDFIARTDHWHASESGEYKGMLLIPGCEYDVGKVTEGGMYHILGLGCGQIAEKTNRPPVQEIIDRIHAAGGLAVLAHPAWSLNTPEQILRLRDVDFTEIFNSISDLPRNCRPYSGLILDMAAVAGRMLTLGAADDMHFCIPADTCRSFIYLQTEALTEERIMEALREGRFYASQGPTLEVRHEGAQIVVDCSPAESVVFYTDKVWKKNRAVAGEDITHGTSIRKPFKPQKGERCRTDKKLYYCLDFAVTPHKLRHTYVTNLINTGIDPKTVQYLAGHKSSQITMDIYAKVKYNRPDKLLKAVEDAFENEENAQKEHE